MDTFILWASKFINYVSLAQLTFSTGQIVLHDHILSFHVIVIDDNLQLTIFAFALYIFIDDFLMKFLMTLSINVFV